MTTYQDFAAEVKEIEQRLAPGSETSVLAHLNNKMHQLAGARWRESEAVMDEGEAQWWRDAYAAYSANEQLPADERETDLQALFDRV